MTLVPREIKEAAKEIHEAAKGKVQQLGAQVRHGHVVATNPLAVDIPDVGRLNADEGHFVLGDNLRALIALNPVKVSETLCLVLMEDGDWHAFDRLSDFDYSLKVVYLTEDMVTDSRVMLERYGPDYHPGYDVLGDLVRFHGIISFDNTGYSSDIHLFTAPGLQQASFENSIWRMCMVQQGGGSYAAGSLYAFGGEVYFGATVPVTGPATDVYLDGLEWRLERS